MAPLSETEVQRYYTGLYSNPFLVARTGTTPWKEPGGLDIYGESKALRAVGNHPLKGVWEVNLALKIHILLDSMDVKWTSTDVVRIGEVRAASAPVILWIGIIPETLSNDRGLLVASKCRELLLEYTITDVDVEIRESVVSRAAGPKLLAPADYQPSELTVSVCDPLTTTLGIPICAQSTPSVEGTGGFFINEGGNTEKLLLVTARHVVFPPDKDANELFERKDESQPHYNVTLFGDAAFNKYVELIKTKIKANGRRIGFLERQVKATEEKYKYFAQDKLKRETETIETLETLYPNVSSHWTSPDTRILGHVVLSPPIEIGAEGYTHDWAVIEVDTSKVDESNFNGNAIDCGTSFIIPRMSNLLYRTDPTCAEFPYNHLLRLKGTIPDSEMRYPSALDNNNEPYLNVLKRGSTSGLTVGHANDVFSYARYGDYKDNVKPETSKEWAILPFDYESGPFAESGDSGSVIVDSQGRIGGLLTGGAGGTAYRYPEFSFDITYAAPISSLLESMRAHGLREINTDPQ